MSGRAVTDVATVDICPQAMSAKILAAMGGEPSLMAICPPGFLARFISGQLQNVLSCHASPRLLRFKGLDQGLQ